MLTINVKAHTNNSYGNTNTNNKYGVFTLVNSNCVNLGVCIEPRYKFFKVRRSHKEVLFINLGLGYSTNEKSHLIRDNTKNKYIHTYNSSITINAKTHSISLPILVKTHITSVSSIPLNAYIKVEPKLLLGHNINIDKSSINNNISYDYTISRFSLIFGTGILLEANGGLFIGISVHKEMSEILKFNNLDINYYKSDFRFEWHLMVGVNLKRSSFVKKKGYKPSQLILYNI